MPTGEEMLESVFPDAKCLMAWIKASTSGRNADMLSLEWMACLLCFSDYHDSHCDIHQLASRST